MKISRRDTLLLAASAALASSMGLGAAQAQEGTTKDVAKLAAVALPDHVLGNPDAKVTVIEYASPTCPHCAQFSNEVYPAFKTAYIDSGKVKFILRPYIRNLQDAVIFLLAEAAADAGVTPAPAADAAAPAADAAAPAADAAAAPATTEAAAPAGTVTESAYHTIIETYFKTQGTWGLDPKPRAALLAQAKLLGFTEESFDAALDNKEKFEALKTMQEQAANEFKLEGTPTFYINGKQLTGEKSLEELGAEIDPLL